MPELIDGPSIVEAAGTKPKRIEEFVGRIAGPAGRDGLHTEALGPLVAQLQSLARAHPEATW